jgi:3-deoxy-D-arabino-heptulosonate 7-phosphate (DAHP) synthase
MPFKEALGRLDNRRVKSTRPLIPPQILQEDLPLYVCSAIYPQLDILICSFRTFLAANTVLEGRRATEAVLSGQDDRLLVVVG